MFEKSLLSSARQLRDLTWTHRIIIGFILIIGFYAWIVFGFGLMGRIDVITAGFAERGDFIGTINASP